MAIRKILRATEVGARMLSRSVGLTSSQVIVLQILLDGGPETAGHIATRIGISQATMTTLLDRLESRGLVGRRRGESDRRQVWVHLEPEGRRIIEGLPDTLHDRFKKEFDHLRDWEQASVIAALERVVDMLGADDFDAAPLLELGTIGQRSEEDL